MKICLLLFLVMLFSCGNNQVCVMKVGSQKVFVKDVLKLVSANHGIKKNGNVSREDVENFCRMIYARQLYYLEEARELGIADVDSVQEKILNEKKKALTKVQGPLYEKVVAGVKEPSGAELEDLYKKRLWVYQIQHILLPSKPLADSVFHLLKGGEKFADLVHRFSFDRRWGDEKGVWKDWFLYGTMGGDFDDTVLSLKPGVAAGPIHTRYGYHIIRVLHKKPREDSPFQKVVKWVRAVYFAMERTRAYFHYQNSLPQKYDFTFDPAAGRLIQSAYSEDAKGLPVLQKAVFTPEQMKMPIAKFRGGELLVRDFVDHYISQRPLLQPPLRRMDAIKEYAKKAAMVDLMYVDAVAMGLDQDPDFQNMARQYRNNILILQCRKVLFQPFEITDEEIRQRYDADSTFHIEKFKDAAKWVRRAIQTEKTNLEDKRQLKYLQDKYPIEFCDKGIKRLVKEINAKP
ncbi:MAG: hypothetical protein GWP06_13720 [Actinobacteria bacterium]|nr:hypothetical protein [Actinomycetota bacterium]